ncbi:MAG: ribulokinase [Eubacteriales bacterium]|nr:ribulokinase [Eubacteriales bacterium]
MSKFSLGLDFGTLSARALIVDVNNGNEVAEAVCDYPNGAMEKSLADGTPLGVDWALQDAEDYTYSIQKSVREAIRKSGVSKEDIIGIGIGFTSCTLLPTLLDGTPLSFLPEFKSTPHAYVKLWKHHASHKHAEIISETAKKRNEPWLARYSHTISSEWMFPKIYHTLDEDPKVYERAECFIEAGDWIAWQITGKLARNSCAAGYKGMWKKQDGYPSKEFFEAVDPRLANVVEEKLPGEILPIGSIHGYLNETYAEKFGLNRGTPVAVSVIDAHCAFPGLAIDKPGSMMLTMGTSSGHMAISDKEYIVPGMCGVVENGIMPGYYGYEAGQAGFGDVLNWFVKNCVGEKIHDEAKSLNMSIHQLLTKKADKLKPGQSGIIALDWLNGNRSVLVNYNLSGMILGMTLQTGPEEIYRALIEALAFGTKIIVNSMIEYGIQIDQIIAAGGIPEKNPMLMQIFADVLNRPIKLAGTKQSVALGAAIYGAVAAGKKNGGYESVFEAASIMGKQKEYSYKPDMGNILIYDRLYGEYKKLHDYFGMGGNNVMENLKDLKREIIDRQ